MREEISSTDSWSFTDFLFVYLIVDSGVMWIYEGSVVPLSPQNINGCFLQLLPFKFVISHRFVKSLVPYSCISDQKCITWYLDSFGVTKQTCCLE